MKKSILFSSLLLISCCLLAQKQTISGYVSDAETGEKLIGVNVYTADNQYGTSSNTYGFFSISLPLGNANLRVSYLGYKTERLKFVLQTDTLLQIQLKPNPNTLQAIEISGTKPTHQTTQVSTLKLPMQQIKKIPVLLGEVDILKVLQLMPGVQSGSEGSSGLYVRGGSPDQNLILLDGVPVYNASHLFGFFSVFNADALKDVTLIKGGFPARYGGRLSAVLDISMKEGNMKKFGGEGSVGLLSSKIMLEGPIVKDKTSFLITARRTYYDLLYRPILKALSGENILNYYFYDITGKINHIFSDKDRLYFSIYAGDDQFSFNNNRENYKEEFGLGWGNVTAALRWNHLFNKKLFSNTSLTFSRYQLSANVLDENKSFVNEMEMVNSSKLNYQSTVRDWTAKIDFDYFPHPKHHIKFGTSATHHTFKPNAIQEFTQNSTDTIPDASIEIGQESTQALEYTLYVENDWKPFSWWQTNLGVHASAFQTGDTWYTSVQPRVSTNFLLNRKLSLKSSFATMTQYIHLLSNNNVGLPTDLWVSATEKVRPQESWQATLGLGGSFFNNIFEWSVEGYYKKMKHVIEYAEGINFLNDGISTDLGQQGENWENLIEVGTGEAYGIEFFLQKKLGQTTGWLGYTLSWSNRQFDNLNQGNSFPYRYDRRHDISIVINHQLSKNVDFSLTWVYGTGNAISLPIAAYSTHPDNGGGEVYEDEQGNIFFSGSQFVDHYEGRNGFRVPAYHRLDVGFNFKKKKKWGERTWSVGIYNLYSRRNPYFVSFAGLTQEPTKVSLFPIIPSVSYQFKF